MTHTHIDVRIGQAHSILLQEILALYVHSGMDWKTGNVIEMAINTVIREKPFLQEYLLENEKTSHLVKALLSIDGVSK